MQENKFDKNQLIGFALMLLLVLGYWYFTKPTPEELAEAEKIENQVAEETKTLEQKEEQIQEVDVSSDVPAQTFTLQNDKVLIELTNKGAQVSKVELKEYKAYNHETNDDDLPLYLFDGNNTNFSLKINDTQGRLIDLSKRTFSASFSVI